jgi:SOS response regulatory protein OraA/RecX
MLDVANNKWSTYPTSDTPAKRRSKLVTFLASRGYESPEIQSMLNEHFSNEE